MKVVNKKHIVVLIALLLILVICIYLYSYTNNKIYHDTYENDISLTIKNKLEDSYTISKFEIKENISKAEDNFILFIFEDKNRVLYEGLAYLNQQNSIYYLKEVDIAQMDTEAAFTHHQYSSFLKNQQPYRLVAGIINNEQISEIRIYYENGTIVANKMDDNRKSYLDVTFGGSIFVKKIEAYDYANNLFYSYNWEDVKSNT